MYENITDDITTSTTKLAIVPTQIVNTNNDVATANVSITESSITSMEQSTEMTSNTTRKNEKTTSKPSVLITQEKTSRKKESGTSEAGKK